MPRYAHGRRWSSPPSVIPIDEVLPAPARGSSRVQPFGGPLSATAVTGHPWTRLLRKAKRPGQSRGQSTKLATASCVMALLGLGACATTDAPGPTVADERDLVDEIETLVDWAGQLNDLAFPIRTANVAACDKRVGADIGASWVTEADLRAWPDDRLDVAKRRFGVSRRPVLDHVVEGGPAAAAGLRRWDKIVAVAGQPMPVDGAGRSDIARILGSGAQDRPIGITYERDGETASGTLTPVTACDIAVTLVDDDEPNAFADGRSVYITTGLYRIETDIGLQAVIAHQMAHILEGHVRSEKARRAIGATADVGVTVAVNALVVFAGLVSALSGDDVEMPDEPLDTGWFLRDTAGRMFAHSDEREADVLSLAMLERSGVPAEAAVEFWRDLAAEPDGFAAFLERHPINDERLGDLDATLTGIVRGRVPPEASAP